jgi:hypothetical protein
MVGNFGRVRWRSGLLPAFEVFRGDGSLSLPTRAQWLIALLAIGGAGEIDCRGTAMSRRI